jgi:hypothetical protein
LVSIIGFFSIFTSSSWCKTSNSSGWSDRILLLESDVVQFSVLFEDLVVDFAEIVSVQIDPL